MPRRPWRSRNEPEDGATGRARATIEGGALSGGFEGMQSMTNEPRDGQRPVAGGDSAELTHFDSRGAARMVDVSGKEITRRTAVAGGSVRLAPETCAVIRTGSAAKGDVLQVARLAGILAAKQTPQLIPLCHAIPLASVQIDFEFTAATELSITATVVAEHRTGVEMEALTAVSVAALTVYDMCKAIDRGMELGPFRLLQKSGGRRGDYTAPA